jgi:hypothetical protein
MAISVDTVYQRVLGILNKEQRGYVTPQEFNLFANQVQEDIFEQYFYDRNQFGREHGNSTEYSDMVDILDEKISLFEVPLKPLTFSTPYYLIPADLYRLGTLSYLGVEVDRINKNDLLYIRQSPKAAPGDDFPVYVKTNAGFTVYGTALFDGTEVVNITYVKKPATVIWGYTSVLGSPQYNASASTDFELHESERPDVIIKILSLAGLEIKDLGLYQSASNEDKKNTVDKKS